MNDEDEDMDYDDEYEDEDCDGYPEGNSLGDGWMEVVLNLPDRNSLGFYTLDEADLLMRMICDGLDRKMGHADDDDGDDEHHGALAKR